MRSAYFAPLTALAVATLCSAAALARDALLDTHLRVNVPHSAETVETLFAGWQMSRALLEDAIDAGADPAEIALLRRAADAAAQAYGTSLLARNSMTFAGADPVPPRHEPVPEQATMAN
ncbi:MAG: hypothetical protein AAGA70_08720 [Pseudomonadota bacterium]